MTFLTLIFAIPMRSTASSKTVDVSRHSSTAALSTVSRQRASSWTSKDGQRVPSEWESSLRDTASLSSGTSSILTIASTPTPTSRNQISFELYNRIMDQIKESTPEIVNKMQHVDVVALQQSFYKAKEATEFNILLFSHLKVYELYKLVDSRLDIDMNINTILHNFKSDPIFANQLIMKLQSTDMTLTRQQQKKAQQVLATLSDNQIQLLTTIVAQNRQIQAFELQLTSATRKLSNGHKVTGVFLAILLGLMAFVVIETLDKK